MKLFPLAGLALFVFLSQGSLNSSQCEEPVQIRLCFSVFVPQNFFLWVNNRIQKYELETLEAK
jgi:hypothetical protein